MSLSIFVVLLWLPCLLQAQQAPSILWQKCFGGTRSDDSSHLSISGHSIIQTQDGFIIAGETNSNDQNVSGNHGLDDIWLTEVNSTGNILRQKCFGGTGYEGACCIIHTSDDGFAVVGWTNSNNGDVSRNHGGFTDIWLLKLDFFWNIQWQKCIGGSGWDIPYSIIQTSDGGFAIGGFTTSNDEGFFNRGSSDSYIVKLNSLGNLQWQKLYGGTSADGGGIILQISDGGYIFAGVTNSDDSDVYGNHRDSTGMTSNDVWLFKIDSAGKMLWQKCLGGSGSDYATSFIKTSNGGYILTGVTTSTDGDVVGRHGANNNSDAWVVNLDSACNILWQKCLGGSAYDDGYSIIQTSDGGYAICGTAKSNDGDVYGYHGSNGNLLEDSSDIWIVKLNSSGAIEWQKCLGGKETDYGFAIIQTKDGGYAIHGRTNSTDGDVTSNHGKEDIWVVKLSPTANVENSTANQSNFSWVFPNPSNDLAHLYLFQSQSIKQIQFYNLLGNQYYPEYQIENNLLSINEHNLPVGSYMVRVSYLNAETEEVRKFLHFH